MRYDFFRTGEVTSRDLDMIDIFVLLMIINLFIKFLYLSQLEILYSLPHASLNLNQSNFPSKLIIIYFFYLVYFLILTCNSVRGRVDLCSRSRHFAEVVIHIVLHYYFKILAGIFITMMTYRLMSTLSFIDLRHLWNGGSFGFRSNRIVIDFHHLAYSTIRITQLVFMQQNYFLLQNIKASDSILSFISPIIAINYIALTGYILYSFENAKIN